MKYPYIKNTFIITVILLSACAVGPDYQRPEIAFPDIYKEQNGWKISEPGQAASDTAWWSIFNDKMLDELEKQVNVSNQNIKAAEAAYQQALYAVDVANASFFPSLSLTAENSSGKARSVVNKTTTSYNQNYSLSPTASWTIDVWGRLRRQVEMAEAGANISEADLAAARLSSQATLATDYFLLRATDELIRLLARTTDAYSKALKITENQYHNGIAAKSDFLQAKTQLETTRAQYINAGIKRSQFEHAIAVLIGKAPAEFSIAPEPDLPDPPVIPLQLPSSLLERRPDIAAAEENVRVANAQIGVGISGFFPDMTIGGSISYEASNLGNLMKSPNPVWAVGPSLSQVLFNAAIYPKVLSYRAYYEQQIATYRQTVLAALQDIEDQLISIQALRHQLEVQNQAVAAANEAEHLITNQYKAGTVSYTSVVTAQTAALAARQSALTIRQSLLTGSISLIQNLGGGWEKKVTDHEPVEMPLSQLEQARE